MARALQQSQPVSDDHSPAQWQSLRQELVTLLDQVDTRVARTRTATLNEALQDPRHPAVDDDENDARHRDALKTVQRAITRFEETPAPLPVVPPPSNPRDSLQAAINQIRARQNDAPPTPQAAPAKAPAAHAPAPVAPPRPATPAPAPRQTVRVPEPQPAPAPAAPAPVAAPAPAPAPAAAQTQLFDKLAQSFNGLSGRLENLEGEIKAQLKSGANIKDVADQVAQLAHVVELLAGAVGETGQVKRLETQIASLGKIMAQGREIDIQTLTRRLDDVAATVGKLAELQVHYADKVQNPVESQAFQDGMHSIEDSVRAVYDRIDKLERTAALPPPELEHLSHEMARLTEALQAGVREPLHLVELVDALNTRISDIESGDRLLHGLRKDLTMLRETIVVSLAPRFEAIEQQIETLSSNVGTREDMAEIGRQIGALGDRIGERPIDSGIGQLEAQVRQLVARMDQTGEQLSGLAKLYATEPQPDYDAISDMVAMKTFEAVQRQALPVPQPDYDAISDMVAMKTFEAVQRQNVPVQQPDYDAISEMVAMKTFEAVQRQNVPAPQPDYDAISEMVAMKTFEAVQRQNVPVPQPDYDAISEMVAMKTFEAVQRQNVPVPQPDYDAISEMVAMKTFEAVQRQNVPVPQPDYDAISEMVAMKTFEAVQRHNPQPDVSLTETIVNLEGRIATMLATMQRDPEVDGIDGMQANIIEVNERLRRLEESLMAQRSTDARVPATDLAPVANDARQPVRRARADTMPRGPAVEAPLVAPAYPEPVGPVGQALDARTGSRGHHPGLADDISLAARYEAPSPPAGFEPGNVAPPPAPQPSAGFLDESLPEPMVAQSSAALEPMAQTVMPSRNTFIEAHRRASQRQQQVAAPGAADVQSNSLIGRALARFQTNADAQPIAETPARLPKPARAAKSAAVPAVMAPVAPGPAIEAPSEADASAAKNAKSSFLLKNRKVILMAAAVVALGFLTANLVAQRLGQSDEAAPVTPVDATPVTTGDISNTLPPPVSAAPVLGQPSGPRVIPMVDSLKTGSIDTSAAQAFTTASPQTMPNAFQAATQLAHADLTGATSPSVPTSPSPVKVELPPDGVGPADLRQAASNGDARAQFEVAAIYTEGRAVPQDYKAAAVWYERSAAQGFAPAQYRLGSLYEQGQGVAKDLNTAKIWYERAAEAGNRMSMHNLAALYAGGQLGKQEFDSAAKWFEEAANRGMTDSQFNLGMLYARGLGVPQSMSDSFKWFGLAALSGDKDAIKARDDIARSLDADTVAKITAEVNAFKQAPVDLAANFAPIGTWTKSFDPGETITTRDIVTSVQKALHKLGYDVGNPDGVAGAKTATAIKAFEKATGMSEVGQINPRLLAVLGSQPV